MDEPLVTVTAYTAPDDARAAQGVLDSAGISAVVDPAPHKTRVRVPNVEALRAGDLLTAKAPELAEIDEADEDERVPEPVCPSCGSPDIGPFRRAQIFGFIVVVAIGVGAAAELAQAASLAVAAAGVILLMAGRWRCRTCSEMWD